MKTVAAVAEAAAAPSAARPAQAAPEARQEMPRSAEVPRTAEVPRRVATAAGAKRAGRSVWAPLATYSSALWLRVTGLFFAMVASVMASGAWRSRGALHPGANPVASRHFWIFLVLAGLFAYFAVRGFARANARERRGARS